MMLFFFQNVPVVTMAMIVNIIVGYALTVPVINMKDQKDSSVKHQVY